MRLALLGSATSLLSYESRALAQIPAQQYQAEAETEPAPAASPAPAALPAPAPVTPLPPAPAAPPGASALPASSNAPAPAKAAVITEHEVRGEAETRVEADELPDEGDAASDFRPRARWYGWQTLTSDAVSLTACIVGLSLDTKRDGFGSTLAWTGLLGYEFAPGLVHFAHRNPGRGFASFGMRIGMPLAGAFIGASLASGCNTLLCEAGGAAVGILVGMGGAIAIDAAVFAYDDRKLRASQRRLLPLVSVNPRQAWIGVGGEL